MEIDVKYPKEDKLFIMETRPTVLDRVKELLRGYEKLEIEAKCPNDWMEKIIVMRIHPMLLEN